MLSMYLKHVKDKTMYIQITEVSETMNDTMESLAESGVQQILQKAFNVAQSKTIPSTNGVEEWNHHESCVSSKGYFIYETGRQTKVYLQFLCNNQQRNWGNFSTLTVMTAPGYIFKLFQIILLIGCSNM